MNLTHTHTHTTKCRASSYIYKVCRESIKLFWIIEKLITWPRTNAHCAIHWLRVWRAVSSQNWTKNMFHMTIKQMTPASDKNVAIKTQTSKDQASSGPHIQCPCPVTCVSFDCHRDWHMDDGLTLHVPVIMLWHIFNFCFVSASSSLLSLNMSSHVTHIWQRFLNYTETHCWYLNFHLCVRFLSSSVLFVLVSFTFWCKSNRSVLSFIFQTSDHNPFQCLSS